MKDNKGFSLIELSIVLIIMGLLVAGITGGASLIKTAQLRSVVTEATNYRRDYNTFYSQYNRVPGSTTDSPNTVVGANAWSQMKENGITDREPNSETIPGVVSKFRGANWYLANNAEISSSAQISDFANLNVLYVAGDYKLEKGAFSGLDAQSIDDKIDDGDGDSGFVRGVKKSGTPSSAFNLREMLSPVSSALAGSNNGTAYTEEKTEGEFSLIMRMDF